MALTNASRVVPSARDIRALRRRFARQHAPRDDRSATIVVFTLGGYMMAGSLWWLAHRPATILADSALLAPGQNWTTTWAWALGAFAIAAGLAVARAFGPITTSSEAFAWLLSTPVDRASMLRQPLLARLALGAFAGLIVGRLAAFAGAVNVWSPLTMLGAAAGVGVVATAALAQCRLLPARIIPIVQWVFVAAGIGMGAAAAVGTTISPVTSWPPVLLVAFSVAAITTISVFAAGRIDRAELDAGADLTVGASVSVTTLDATALTGTLDNRAWRRVGKSKSERLPPGRARAMIRADLLRHLRRPSSFAIAAGVVGLAWATTSVGTPLGMALTQLAAVFVVALVFSSGLRELCTNDELRMLLGAGDRTLRLPLLVVPLCAAGSAVALIATTTALSLPTLLITTAGAVLGAYRMRTRPAAADGGGLILETGFGQLPIEMIRQLLRGPDILLLSTLVLIAVT